MKRIACLLVLLIPISALAAEVYKWTDEKGRVHYGDRPRTQDAKKVEINPGSGDGGAGAARQASDLEKLKMQDKKYADCKNRREQVTAWKAAGKIVEKDGLGREKTYTDEEKQTLLERTQSSIDKDCAGV